MLFSNIFQLAYCVVQFLEKDASLTEDVSIIIPFKPQEKNSQLHFKLCLIPFGLLCFQRNGCSKVIPESFILCLIGMDEVYAATNWAH